jgi:hypothetical protein
VPELLAGWPDPVEFVLPVLDVPSAEVDDEVLSAGVAAPSAGALGDAPPTLITVETPPVERCLTLALPVVVVVTVVVVDGVGLAVSSADVLSARVDPAEAACGGVEAVTAGVAGSVGDGADCCTGAGCAAGLLAGAIAAARAWW